MATTIYLAKFRNPRAITRPNIIGPERNVNMDCNSSLYTHIPKIKSISPLGIYFGHDINKCDELNWEGKINQMKTLLIS